MNMSQYMSVFIDESKEHLQLLNDALLRLEKEPDEHSTVEEIFRSAHTLKGMSATMGFTRTAELTHNMENVLDLIRNSKLSVTSEIVDVLFECLDRLNLLIDEVIDKGEETTEIEDLSSKLESISKGNGKKESHTPAAAKEESSSSAATAKESNAKEISIDINFNEFEKQLLEESKHKNMSNFVFKIILDDGCLLKAARTYMVFRTLEEHGEIIKSVPTAQELEEEKFDNSFIVAYVTEKNSDEIRKKIMSISEIKEVESQEILLDEESEGSRKEEKSIKEEEKKKSEKAVAKGGEDKKTDKPSKITTVRVDTEKLDALMNLVAELVINKTRLAQIGTEYNLHELSETLSHVDRVTSDLQEVVTKVRMVPIENVFNRFPRMVRDLSKELKKDIELVIEGKETELDRTVIDEIGDPLVHLIRNSLDHGIESPEDRKNKGKDEKGTILLKAEHEGNNVVITISDDGKGIDKKVIAQKIIEKGIATDEEVNMMEESQIISYIFHSGFSTAAQITDVSGRGVGMDVVKNKIEGLNGQIEVTTKVGEGTVTKIKLPLTLAIIEALLVRLTKEIYAIPLANIVETIDIDKNSIKVIQNENVIVLRGEVVPIIDLAKLLEEPGYEKKDIPNMTVVIVKVGNKKIGIIVDFLIGQQEIVIKSLGKLFTGIKGITGATVLGNGEVALIIDVLTLV